MSDARWVVHKFGGTSVKDAGMFQRVKAIVESEKVPGTRTAVVVSAMSKVTDALFNLCTRAARPYDAAIDDGGASDVDGPLLSLVERHHETIEALLGETQPATAAALKGRISKDAADILQLLNAVRLLRQRTEVIDEVVAGHGELWSAQILAALLGCPWMDARKTLVVTPGELGPVVDEDVSRIRTQAFCVGVGDLVVVTGYVASTPEGVPTTLKRNGSDFSASIFGALLDATAVTIWTDVDGVLSADPRRVSEAVVLDEMSYEEAMELAYFGAKVVHPRTMQPAVDRGIPIWIRNTFRPELRGTVIHRTAKASASSSGTSSGSAAKVPMVKGFTTIDDIALLNLEGAGMVGVPGVAERLFGALRRGGVSVVVISQASSEHSICFAVPEAQADQARAVVDEAFALVKGPGLKPSSTKGMRVDVQRGCSVLAAVGDGMAQHAGVAGKFFTALGDVGVSVRAVAQGSSERNVTAIIDGKDSTRALRAVHARFTLSKLTLSVGLVGPGLIGKALLAQLAAQRTQLKERFNVDVRVAVVASRSGMTLEDGTVLPLSSAADWAAFSEHVRPAHLPHAVVVDCSASDDVADRYAGWLKSGIHVVTPNKRAASGPLSRWRDIAEASRRGPARYHGEATVGAGLPVIATLKELLNTGDDVIAVEGVLSGTLSWIFNTLRPISEGGESFSSKVRAAKALGYTEPDPREDLSGQDFARKLVVLAREMGRAVSLDDVVIEDLAPGLPFGAPLEELLAGLAHPQPGVDAAMEKRLQQCALEGRVLRMVGAVPEHGPPTVSLQALPTSHPFARLDGTDNMLCFRTRRYATRPLVVQGPGAGAEVTAGGVFGDLLRIAARLGGDV